MDLEDRLRNVANELFGEILEPREYVTISLKVPDGVTAESIEQIMLDNLERPHGIMLDSMVELRSEEEYDWTPDNYYGPVVHIRVRKDEKSIEEAISKLKKSSELIHKTIEHRGVDTSRYVVDGYFREQEFNP